MKKITIVEKEQNYVSFSSTTIRMGLCDKIQILEAMCVVWSDTQFMKPHRLVIEKLKWLKYAKNAIRNRNWNLLKFHWNKSNRIDRVIVIFISFIKRLNNKFIN